jgi:membrane protein DedA with SNARE-associated domain
MDFQTVVQQTVDFVRLNQAWAVPVVFALAFGESLAFISLLLPAWGALVAIGALIRLKRNQVLANMGRSVTGCSPR